MSELTCEAAGISRLSTHAEAPEELWIVTDKDGQLPRVCTSAKDAETVRAYRQLDTPSLGPHFVAHYVKASR